MHHHQDGIGVHVFIFVISKSIAEFYKIACLYLDAKSVVFVDCLEVGEVFFRGAGRCENK